jgi:5'-nucleotidase (lipoprotein e(P4) family)
MKQSTRTTAPWICGFLCGVCIPGAAWIIQRLPGVQAQEVKKAPPVAETHAAQGTAMETPPYRGLDANLFMQTSAEYRACCLQAYHFADRVIDDRFKLTAQNSLDKPNAVVFDLDETVLDNGRFQTKQIRDGVAFDPSRWSVWEQNGGSELDIIPGAMPFIEKLESIGVERVYITNRNETCHAQTLEALARLGLSVPPDQLLCASEATGTNKTKRRELVEARFHVLLYVGDNLRDFDEVFRYNEQAGIDGRKRLVDERREKFGRDWIILPNPAYGEWLKPLGRGEADANQLLPRL